MLNLLKPFIEIEEIDENCEDFIQVAGSLKKPIGEVATGTPVRLELKEDDGNGMILQVWDFAGTTILDTANVELTII